MQFRQATPRLPQLPSLSPGLQVPLAAQHPLAHEVGSQTQLPATQCSPLAHAEPVPHLQLPAEQPSAAIGLHAKHAAPLVPHAAALGGAVHVEPEQHPVAQLVAVQLEHTWLVQLPEHTLHAAPPEPQCCAVVPASQVVPLQQPPAQLTLSHLQTPPTQCCPLAHGDPEPHTHAPVALQPSLVIPQATHAPPAGAHVPAEAGKQMLLAQQPPGHEVASHTQPPETQRCPAPQAACPPQLQLPAVQLLAVAPQSTHAPPPLPHAPTAGVVQTLPLQQPLGQEAALQTQTPPTQFCPPLQAAPPPQLQAPLVQPSARVESQARQLEPPEPQVATAAVVQVTPEQHPAGHVAELQPEHEPPEHVWPLGQVWHVWPPAPHMAGWSPAWQVVPLQQPLGQDVPSQTQVPPEQRWPAAQTAPAPQAQAPPTQLSAVKALQLVQAPPPEPQLPVEAG